MDNGTWQMQNTPTADLLVIGGGITGLGVARDAALRGLSVVLLERGDLGSGTSGYFHELLHSGARYVTNDPASARECYLENQTLRNIAGSSITQSGGLFLAVTDTDLAFSELFLASCKKVGIPVEELNVQKVLHDEPRISRALKRVFSVPDGRIDGKKLLNDTKASAERNGAQILSRHEVVSFHKENGRIQIITARDITTNETCEIEARYVVNAAGVWASRVAALAGISLPLLADKGVMIVFDDKPSEKVLNRLRKPSNGDILVPLETQSIWGTTSSKTDELDTHEATEEEISLLLKEADTLVPKLSESKITRVFAGVRPLYPADPDSADEREISRSFQIINHKQDDLVNFSSIVGGKFMLHRLMAEKAVDEACKEVGISKPCQTAEILL
jgi:glycerol-3-phosphate dehydrogenase